MIKNMAAGMPGWMKKGEALPDKQCYAHAFVMFSRLIGSSSPKAGSTGIA